MTRERIEDFREIVLPFVKKRLLETNYENLGESDAEMFAKDFDEILNLAIKALEQEPRWIPVSERLPEINEEAYSDSVLLSLRKTEWDIDKCQMAHITTIGYYDENAISSDGVYLDTEGWELGNGRTLPLSDVIAWMPLPTNYSEVEE